MRIWAGAREVGNEKTVEVAELTEDDDAYWECEEDDRWKDCWHSFPLQM